MEAPVLYILAGPNGIGKTTSAFDLIPKNVPIINSDEIAKLVKAAGVVKVNTQEYSNREAQKLVADHLEKRSSFAIETNLSDEETWKFLIGVQQSGYQLHLVFLSTDDLPLLHDRINERTLRGEHFVRPDIVEERYYTGLRLLKHYLQVPDVVQLIDNGVPLTPVALKKGDEWKMVSPHPPAWFLDYLAPHFNPPKKETPVKDLKNIEEVKERYREKGKS